jgi:hypothetical protein
VIIVVVAYSGNLAALRRMASRPGEHVKGVTQDLCARGDGDPIAQVAEQRDGLLIEIDLESRTSCHI